ncbi:MAG: signal recognition particle-docking protein FtsY [Proteobacteria bacterium]|nr:signal recognition particle-docking protein FtsY [Pseudomonadota bacterium]
MSADKDTGGWWSRLRSGMRRSAASLGDNLNELLTQRRLDDAAVNELVELLIAADLGVAAAERIAGRIARQRFDPAAPPEQVREALADEIAAVLAPAERPIDWNAAKPFVLLVVGVNGSGKTTTIGKIAHRLRTQGKSVVLAAGDTFRAAAIDQLKIWGERAGATVVAREPGADAAGLAFDAVAGAERDGADVVLIDTAGRLQNKADLMAELGKVVRVLKKRDAAAPHGVLLVLDATTGQNARAQVAAFQELAGVTALAMTKLDGTAHGGMLVALAAEFLLPVAYVGVGEAVEDLQPFDAKSFSRALVGLGL